VKFRLISEENKCILLATKIMMKTNKYSITLLLSIVILIVLFYILHVLGADTVENRLYLKHFLSGAFVVGILLTGWYEMGKPGISKSLFNVRYLLLLSLSLLLVLSINQQAGTYATGFFVFCSVIYLLKTGKWYSINKIYYVIFAFALLRIVGTYGTVEGFRVPDKVLSFYFLPLAFSCFRIEKNTALRILRFFFRSIMIYMSFALIYWWSNIQFFGIPVIDWLTKKMGEVGGLEPFHWATSWAYYVHPSYISLVVVSAMISGFYLYYKKQASSEVYKVELTIFSVLSVLTVLILESRIGTVCLGFVFSVTGLYYLHLKSHYFKTAFFGLILIGVIGLFFKGDSVSGFLTDNVRKTDYTLAVNYIKDHPWWGAGFHEQATALSSQAQIMQDTLPLLPRHKTYTHNQFLGEMVQFGIPGAIFLILLLIVLFRDALLSRSYLLQVFLGVYLVFMLIEEPLYVQAGITRFLVFLTFFIHISESKKPIKCISIFKRSLKSQE